MLLKRTSSMMALAAMLSGTAAMPALAQEAASEVATDQDAAAGARVYTLADLATFAPQTALDMVSRIPGFSIDGGNQGNRGLGQASQNVLINGERVAGKSNDAFDALRRISASKVIRIEIIDGATLDVPGLSGEVANVIYEAGGITGNFNYNFQYRPRLENTYFNGGANISGGSSNEDWSLSVSTNHRRQGHWGPEFVRDANGALLITREEFGTYNGDSPRIAGTYQRTATNGNVLNLSASAQNNDQRNTITGDVLLADGTTFEELFRGTSDGWNSEVGADYALDLGGGRLTVIGLQRNSRSEGSSAFGIVGGDTDIFLQDNRQNETIARAEYGFKRSSSDWEISLEGAYNRLDASPSLQFIPVTGAPVETILPENQIEELRSEAIVSLSRPIASDLSLQLNGGAEYSRISAAGTDARAYFRPKGSANLSWRASERVTIDTRIERVVDQLNFFQFLAAVDVQDDVDRGRNNDIVPPERWRGRIEAVVNLAEFGSITPYAQFERIENIIEFVPISPTEEALGNAGSADVWLLGIDGTLLLDPGGIKGARFDLHAHTAGSTFEDPLLLIDRPLSGFEYTHVNVTFRHDIPGTDWAYSTSVNAFHTEDNFRRTQISRGFKSRPDLNLFVEHKDVFGLRVNAGIVNLLDQGDAFSRTVYSGNRFGPVSFTEDRLREYGRLAIVNVSGNF